MKIRSFALLLVMAVLAVAATGCGEKKDQLTPSGSTQVRLLLDFFPNADHVGIYRARTQGAFARAGLSVDIKPPPDPSSVLPLLRAGKVDFAISYEPEVLLARDQAPDLVAIAAIVQKPLTSLISLPPHPIRNAGGLRGKVVGTAGIPYQAAYLKTMLAGAGVPDDAVTQVKLGFNLNPPLIAKRVDATLGGYLNVEALQLQQRGKHPTVVPVDRLGVPTYDELVLVARRQTLSDHPDVARRLVQALALGYEATQSLVQSASGLDPALTAKSVRVSLPYFFPASGHPWGFMDPGKWRAFGDWMKKNGLVTHAPDADNAVTNEFLAGQGPVG
jgi:putative hydroxymethylpyrimidine transport system substrate-binding protein